MTQAEITGKRDLNFSGWIREKLPDSATGFLVSDLDFIIYNYNTRKIMLVEVKTRNTELKYWQETLFSNIARWLSQGMDRDWCFLGFHTIRFENTCFDDGKVFFDNNEISENDLIKNLSL